MHSDWLIFLKIFLPETTQPMDLLHGVNDPRMVLYQVCVFVADPKSKINIGAYGKYIQTSSQKPFYRLNQDNA
jgi:hypothetical protein